MGKFLLSILLLITSFSSACFSQSPDNDERLRDIILRRGQAEVTLPYTGSIDMDYLSRHVSVISVTDGYSHVILSTLTIDWFIFQKYNYTIVEKAEVKNFTAVPVVRLLADWDTYPTYSQYDSIMQRLATSYPGICQLDTIGTSVKGKLILVLRITGNKGNVDAKPEVFYSSTMHGDETGGFILMLRLADYLVNNYGLNDRVTTLMDNLQIWINPLANPDGTYNNGDEISNPIRFNANGYDLNRNFPDPFTPNTIKQKETIEMIRFMREHRFVLSANFHSGSEVVNYPWDRWLSKLHADDTWFYNISRAYADTVHHYAGPVYMSFLDNGITRGAVWYIVYGGRQDFITSELQGREVTIELDNQLVTPGPQLPLLWQDNWHSLLGYLENAMYGIHGKVSSSETSLPVPAKVFIAGHDIDSSQVYSDTLSGRFVRFLAPGSWDLSFSAKGYRDTTVSNIFVNTGERYDLNVEMAPLSEGKDTVAQVKAEIYPNPATTEIRVLLPDLMTGSVKIMIYDRLGRLLTDYNTDYSSGIPLIIDTQYLAGGTYSIILVNRISQVVVRGRFVIVK
jgi:hypothetical protein